MLFCKPWRRALLIGVSGALVLGAAAGPAAAYSEADELLIAKFISGFSCQDGGKAERSRAWYEEYALIQDEAPYETKSNILLHSTAVRMIDDDRLDYQVYFGVFQSGNFVFNPRSRQKICENQRDFALATKRVVVDNKGTIKACCATEDGMQQFFDKKLNDNLALSVRESPEDVEKVIDEMAKKAAEDDLGRPYQDMDSDDKEEADQFAKDFKESFMQTIGLTPQQLADAKASQPDKYKEKLLCNPDSDGNCQYL